MRISEKVKVPDNTYYTGLTERKQAENLLSETNARLKVFQQVTAAVHSTLNLEQVFQQVTDSAIYSMGYNTAFVMVINDEKDRFEIKALSTKKRLLPQIGKVLGFSLKNLSIPVSYDLNTNISSVLEGRIVVVKNLAEVAHPIISQKACSALEKLGGTKNCIVAPLKVGEGVVGAVFISSTREEVSEEELRMIETFAQTASNAIRNANLHTQTKWAEEQMKTSLEEKETLLKELSAINEHLEQEITERKKIEDELMESEERFRIASQIASDVVYERDLQTAWHPGPPR